MLHFILSCREQVIHGVESIKSYLLMNLSRRKSLFAYILKRRGPAFGAPVVSTKLLSLAIPAWVGAMSASQKAVMLCGWGVKAGMVRVWVAGKTV